MTLVSFFFFFFFYIILYLYILLLVILTSELIRFTYPSRRTKGKESFQSLACSERARRYACTSTDSPSFQNTGLYYVIYRCFLQCRKPSFVEGQLTEAMNCLKNKLPRHARAATPTDICCMSRYHCATRREEIQNV